MSVQRRHLTTAAVQEMKIVLTHKVDLIVYATKGTVKMNLGKNVKVGSLLWKLLITRYS